MRVNVTHVRGDDDAAAARRGSRLVRHQRFAASTMEAITAGCSCSRCSFCGSCPSAVLSRSLPIIAIFPLFLVAAARPVWDSPVMVQALLREFVERCEPLVEARGIGVQVLPTPPLGECEQEGNVTPQLEAARARPRVGTARRLRAARSSIGQHASFCLPAACGYTSREEARVLVRSFLVRQTQTKDKIATA